MKKLFTFLIFVVCCVAAKAQYVNIPDSNFRNWLLKEAPLCFNNLNWLDTVLASNHTSSSTAGLYAEFDCSGENIKSIQGVQYFKKLFTLNCSNNLIDTIIDLPNDLVRLDATMNLLKKLPTLPKNLESLYCGNNLLDELPNLPASLYSLYCYDNKLKKLPFLPSNLWYLDFSDNEVDTLNYLPLGLQTLVFDNNKINKVPPLTDNVWLSLLYCRNNNFSCLPYLPINLTNLETTVQCIPNLPPNLLPLYNICNPTNNPNNCQSFPTIQSYSHINNNPKHNLKLTLSNNNYSYTNTQGTAYLNVDSLGTYTITAQAPPLYQVVPPSYTHF